METLTIKLAGSEYKIQPLTVGQLQDLHIGVARGVPQDVEEGVKQFWSKNIDMIAIALELEHPEITREVLSKMRLGSVKAVNETVSKILVFAGLNEPRKSLRELRAQVKALQEEIKQREEENAALLGEESPAA